MVQLSFVLASPTVFGGIFGIFWSDLFDPAISDRAAPGRAVKSFEGYFIVGNIQDGLKSPRHSYHQWQVPDAPWLLWVFSHFAVENGPCMDDLAYFAIKH